MSERIARQHCERSAAEVCPTQCTERTDLEKILLTLRLNVSAGQRARAHTPMCPPMGEPTAAPQPVGVALDALFGGDPSARLKVVRTGPRDEIDPFVKRGVWIRDAGRCRWCGCSDRGRMVLDHIVPWSAGGSDRSDNLRVLCWDCNDRRSNYRTDSQIARVLPVALMCTRCADRDGGVGWRDRWDDERVGEPLDVDDPVAAFCVECRFAGVTDRRWTR